MHYNILSFPSVYNPAEEAILEEVLLGKQVGEKGFCLCRLNRLKSNFSSPHPPYMLTVVLMIFLFLPFCCLAQEGAVSNSSYFRDFSEHFYVEYQEGKGFVALDKKNRVLFVIYPFDNGPDYPSEGLFRIINQGKIGFANLKGEVVIEPYFSAVLPFHGGLAAFCEGCSMEKEGEYMRWTKGQWGFINQKGEIVIPAQFNRVIRDFRNGLALVKIDGRRMMINSLGHTVSEEEKYLYRLTNLLGKLLVYLAKEAFPSLKTQISWLTSPAPFYFFNPLPALEFRVLSPTSQDTLKTYLIIPWQDLRVEEELPPREILLGVTDYAIVYEILLSSSLLNSEEEKIAQEFHELFLKMIDLGKTQIVSLDTKKRISSDLRIISFKEFPHYCEIEIALTSSKLPSRLKEKLSCGDKMVLVHLVPDQGPIQSIWFRPP